MHVRHGRFFEAIGRPCRSGELFICPAHVEIDDPHDCHPLSDTFRPQMDEVVAWDNPYEAQPASDALWVRSRLPVVFGYRPLHVTDGRTYLLDHGFVAVFDAVGPAPTAVPFACADDFCRNSHLVMSRSVSPVLRERIALGFWGLLAAEGGEGYDFRAEGLEWAYAYHIYDMDGEELLTEVGRWQGRFYGHATEWDRDLDPNSGRPDWSDGQWRCRWSKPKRFVRRCA